MSENIGKASQLLGKQINYKGELGEVISVAKASRPPILLSRHSDGMSIETQERYDIKIRMPNGKLATVKNLKVE